MTPISRLHYEFIQESNRSDSQYLKNTSAAQRDFLFNKAIENLVQYYADFVEVNDTVRQYLREITIRGSEVKGALKGDYFIAKYPDNFLKPLKVFIEVGKTGCVENRKLLVRRLPSDKIDRALKNQNTKRLWDFEETFGQESSEGFEIYVSDLKPVRVVFDYVRKVKKVRGPEFENAEQYITTEGEAVTDNVDLELSHPDLVNKIISLAVLFGHRNMGNITDFKTRYESIVNLERLYS